MTKITITTALISILSLPALGVHHEFIRPEDNEFIVESKKKEDKDSALKRLQKELLTLKRKKGLSRSEKNRLKELKKLVAKGI